MFKRLFWIAVGAAGALWGEHKVRRAAERLTPQYVADKAVDAASGTAKLAKRGARVAATRARRSMQAQMHQPISRPTHRPMKGQRQQVPSAATEADSLPL